MDKFDTEVRKEINSFLHDNVQFTSAEKRRIQEKISNQKSLGERINPVYWSVLTAAVVLSIFLSYSYLMDSRGGSSLTEQNSPTNEETSDLNGNQNSVYSGNPLSIGVIGEVPAFSSDRITFKSLEPNALKSKTKEFDAVFVTDRYFEELSTDEWTSTFEDLQIPAFFLGLDVQAFIFYEDGMEYNSLAYEANSHTQGIANSDAGRKSWEYGDPMASTDPKDTPEEIFHLIFEDIEKYQMNK